MSRIVFRKSCTIPLTIFDDVRVSKIRYFTKLKPQIKEFGCGGIKYQYNGQGNYAFEISPEKGIKFVIIVCEDEKFIHVSYGCNNDNCTLEEFVIMSELSDIIRRDITVNVVNWPRFHSNDVKRFKAFEEYDINLSSNDNIVAIVYADGFIDKTKSTDICGKLVHSQDSLIDIYLENGNVRIMNAYEDKRSIVGFYINNGVELSFLKLGSSVARATSSSNVIEHTREKLTFTQRMKFKLRK